jgi:hypothetical protein
VAVTVGLQLEMKLPLNFCFCQTVLLLLSSSAKFLKLEMVEESWSSSFFSSNDSYEIIKKRMYVSLCWYIYSSVCFYICNRCLIISSSLYLPVCLYQSILFSFHRPTLSFINLSTSIICIYISYYYFSLNYSLLLFFSFHSSFLHL